MLSVQVDWDGSDLSGGDDEGDDMLEKLRRNFMATLNQVGDEVSASGPTSVATL